VLLQMVDEANPNSVNCMDNVRRLEAAGLDVMTVDWLPYDEVAGEQIAASYMNLYICNGAVIVPMAGQQMGRGRDRPDRRGVPAARGRAGPRRRARLRRRRPALHHPAAARGLARSG
jgi:hypothetical protein